LTAFNDCRCARCDAKVGWLGELSNPPPCPECDYINNYSDVAEELEKARVVFTEILDLEEFAAIEQSMGNVDTAESLFEKAKQLREKHNFL
jgi:NAD-dependent SIR2 family protein deacetylase